MSDRLEIIERRQILLMRAMRNEFVSAPIGEFERLWNEIDPGTPAPTRAEVHETREGLREQLCGVTDLMRGHHA